MNTELQNNRIFYSLTRLEETANTFRKLGETYEDMGTKNTMSETIKKQLFMFADVLENCAGTKTTVIELSKTRENQLIKTFLSKGIKMKWIMVLQRTADKKEIVTELKTTRKYCINTKEIAEELGKFFGEEFISTAENRITVNEEFHKYTFVQETRFRVLDGIARYSKERNEVSGDNFMISTLDCGRTVAALSDGCGSGRKAFYESQMVIELMEQCLETGFDEKTSVEMINSAFVAGEYGGNPVTVDLGIIDRNLGVLNCIKLGAVSTFIKRESWVEIIKSTTLPIGVLEQVDYDCTAKKLYDGDYVVMVSDGVLENLPVLNKEQELVDIIDSITVKAPDIIAREILNRALEYNKKIAKDDMTVIVMGLFDTYTK